MKHLKQFITRKHWLIDSDDIDYRAAALNKIGMDKNEHWYEFALRLNDPFFVTYTEYNKKIQNNIIPTYLWGVKFLSESSLLKNSEYQGEVIPEPYEIKALQYNL